MILRIVEYPAPVLRTKGARIQQITDEIRALASDMIETMIQSKGCGLAAQQVGKALQLTVINVPESDITPSSMIIDGGTANLNEWMPLVLLNPELTLGSEKEWGTEGCLSFPEVTGDIERAALVSVVGQLLDERKISFEATGLLARALQHEIDHLNGILFLDRMNSAAKLGNLSKLKRAHKAAK